MNVVRCCACPLIKALDYGDHVDHHPVVHTRVRLGVALSLLEHGLRSRGCGRSRPPQRWNRCSGWSEPQYSRKQMASAFTGRVG